jgi:acyl-CoA thioesterase-1
VTDLVERWERDVISLNPDIVSISIGINDVWRQLDSPEIEQVFQRNLKKYLNLSLQALMKKPKLLLY